MKARDLTGQRYSRLVVTARYDSYRGHLRWLCTCDCGQERIVRGSALHSGNTKSCGCLDREVLVNRNRSNRTFGPQEPRSTEAYRQWRTAVYTRDNFTCQECGDYGVRLEADHILPWSKYPELRFDVDNGRTLCVDCHRKTDTYGGRSRN